MNLRIKCFTIVIALVLVLSSVSTAFAADGEQGATGTNENSPTEMNVYPIETSWADNEFQSNGVFKDVIYRKADVSVSHEWSKGKRISDNVVSKSKGGSIKSTDSVTIHGSITGNIFGIVISGDMSITSEKEYTLNTDPNTTQYLAYKAYYRVENGTRETRDMMTNKLVSKNNYTVKTIDHGQYYLVTVK